MSNFFTLKSDIKDKEYNEIAQGFLQEKKSKFISYIFSINNKEDAEKYISEIKNNNKEARHVVYIYSYLDNNNLNVKFSDDGEPQGTGTRAIYELMTKECLTNICIVIVRYFGGILLGAGPLSRAYLNSAKEAIDKCEKTEIYNYIDLEFEVNYNNYNSVKYIIDNYQDREIIVKNTDFGDNICIKLQVVDFEVENFKSKLDGYIL